MRWFVRLPALLRTEIRDLAGRYPEFKLVTSESAAERIAFLGRLPLRTRDGVSHQAFALVYPPEFPLEYPKVYPLAGIEPGATLDDIIAVANVTFLSARHQMADGSLCLFEAPHAAGAPRLVHGVDALQRAEVWWRCARKRRFPPELDSLEAELAGHYQSQHDILLGPACFEDTTARGGAFLAFNTGRSDGRRLFAITHIQGSGGLASDTSFMSRMYPGIPDSVRSTFGKDEPAVADVRPAAVGEQFCAGRWFQLAEEPRPFRTTRELAEVLFPGDADPIRRLNREFSVERATSARVAFGLRFPGRGREPGPKWLFLSVELREGDVPLESAGGFRAPIVGNREDGAVAAWERGQLGSLRHHDLRRRALELRNLGSMAPTTSDLRLTLAGAGGLGSTCADLLAKAGVAALALWDNGVLEAANAIRHLASVQDTGQPKILPVAVACVMHNPHVEVSCNAGSVTAPEGTTTTALWANPVILSTIADDATELILNRRASERAAVTVYYLRALRRGTVGRLVRVRPGIDACLECLALYDKESAPAAIVVEADAGEVVARECGQAVLAASAADLAVVGGFGIRLLLDDLTKSGGGGTNQWAWTVTGVPDHPQLGRAFSMHQTTLGPHASCGVCHVHGVESVGLEARIRGAMIALAEAAAPNETGGILVGRRVGAALEVLAASGPGPKAISLPERFERDGSYCQRFLEAMVAELGSGVDYVGEWHSHPGATGAASHRDMLSLTDIAADDDYLTDEPLMIIVGLPAQGAPTPDIRATIHPRGKCSYKVELLESGS